MPLAFGHMLICDMQPSSRLRVTSRSSPLLIRESLAYTALLLCTAVSRLVMPHRYVCRILMPLGPTVSIDSEMKQPALLDWYLSDSWKFGYCQLCCRFCRCDRHLIWSLFICCCYQRLKRSTLLPLGYPGWTIPPE